MFDASTFFEMLAARPRRRALLSLRGAEAVRVAELTEERDGSGPAAGGRQVSRRVAGQDSGRAAVELHHEHLPKLADADLIEWEPGADRFARGPAFESVRPALDLVAANGDAFPGSLE